MKFVLMFLCFGMLFDGLMFQDTSIMISLSPSDNGKVYRNSTVSIVCSVDLRQLMSRDVYWFRRQGANRQLFGTNYILSTDIKAARYHLELASSASGQYAYKLTIQNVQPQDTATIECSAGPTSSRQASVVLAVCDKGDTAVCECILSNGWTSPACFDIQQEDKGYRRATIGLGVCVGASLLFAVIATLLVVSDCRTRAEALKEEKAEQAASLASRTAEISSRTAASSVMKNSASSKDASVQPRTTVRFSDGSPSTGNRSLEGSY